MSLPEFHHPRLEQSGAGVAKGAGLARHEGNFRSAAEEPLSINELLALLDSIEESDVRGRKDAIACVLSASEGWQDALHQLGGAFAEQGPGLRARKDDLPAD